MPLKNTKHAIKTNQICQTISASKQVSMCTDTRNVMGAVVFVTAIIRVIVSGSM